HRSCCQFSIGLFPFPLRAGGLSVLDGVGRPDRGEEGYRSGDAAVPRRGRRGTSVGKIGYQWGKRRDRGGKPGVLRRPLPVSGEERGNVDVSSPLRVGSPQRVRLWKGGMDATSTQAVHAGEVTPVEV